MKGSRMKLVWQQPLHVRSFDVGAGGRLRVDALMGLWQEAANAHTQACHIGVRDLMARGLTWVLSRYRLCIERLPLMDEALTARTWPSGLDERFTLRNFELRDAEGEILARAVTSWVLFDLKAHAPISPGLVVSPEIIFDEQIIDAPFQKMPDFDEANAQGARELDIGVQDRDLDINGHVGHAVYPQWAFEAIAPEEKRALAIRDIEVSYRAEARQSEVVRARVRAIDGTGGQRAFVHQILNRDTGRELARLVSRWRLKGQGASGH